MTVQLIYAPSDTHIWAESYDRDLNEIFSLPLELAQTIAKEVNTAVSPARPPRNTILLVKPLWQTHSRVRAVLARPFAACRKMGRSIYSRNPFDSNSCRGTSIGGNFSCSFAPI
jgi:hypothetical protein